MCDPSRSPPFPSQGKNALLPHGTYPGTVCNGRFCRKDGVTDTILDMPHEHSRAWSAHDAAKVALCYTEHSAATGEVVKGREGLKATFANNPDIEVEVKNAFVSGNRSASEMPMTSTNTGRGPPTDNPFSVRVSRVAEYEGDLMKRTTHLLRLSSSAR
jgi:hypothetical protein